SALPQRRGLYFDGDDQLPLGFWGLVGVRSDVPSGVLAASVPTAPFEVALGVRSGEGLPGVRSDVLPCGWALGSAGLSLEAPDFGGFVALSSENAGAAVSVMAANASAK